MYKDNGIELWVGHAKTMRARMLAEAQVNAAGRSPYRWMPDSRHILCRMIPRDRGDMPQRSAIPAGPVVEENAGRVSPVRTYQDLLTGPHDVAMFDWIMTSRLVMLDCASNERAIIGGPAIYSNFDPSPDGNYLLVSTIRKPYSSNQLRPIAIASSSISGSIQPPPTLSIVCALRCGKAVSTSPTRFITPPAVCVNIAIRGSAT